MIHSKKTVILSICLCLIHVVNAQVSPYEIKKGNPLRKTLLDVVRTPTSAELGQKVEFVVSTLLSKGDWAFVQGQLQQSGGKALDKTKFVDKDYLERGREGIFDDNFQAVLQTSNFKLDYFLPKKVFVYETHTNFATFGILDASNHFDLGID